MALSPQTDDSPRHHSGAKSHQLQTVFEKVLQFCHAANLKMDPFTLATGIIGIIGLAIQVEQTLQDYISAVKSASKDAQTLRIEIKALRYTSEQLRTFLNSDRVSQKQFIQTGSILALTTSECTSTLQELQQKLGSGKDKSLKILAQLTWPFRKEDIQRAVQVLKGFNSILQYSLTVDGWYVNTTWLMSLTLNSYSALLSQVSTDVRKVLEVQIDLSQKLHNVQKGIAAHSVLAEEHQRTSENLVMVLESIRTLPDISERLTNISDGIGGLMIEAERTSLAKFH